MNKKRFIKKYQKWLSLLFALGILISLSILILNLRSTGEAGKLFKIPPKSLQFVNPKDGCYIKINEHQVYWLINDQDVCKSLFIASKYAGRKNLYRLLYSLKYPSAPVSKTGLNLINTGEAEKVVLTNKNNKLTIFYYKTSKYDYFDTLISKFSASSCQELEFFGVKLYCFNAIEFNGATKKVDTLQYVIPYLTVLRYTNKLHYNPLIGTDVQPYNFIVNTGIKFYDASASLFYGETTIDANCAKEDTSANYQDDNGQSRVYLCSKMLKDGLNEYFKAAIIYHEANHKYDALSHNSDTSMGHSQDLESPICAKATEETEKRGDKDWVSVYGAHINYLFSMSQKEILPCNVREDIFDQAEEELATKLCQKPNKPKHGFSKPICS